MVNGFEDNTFRPNEKITRAEVAKIVENLDELYYKSINVTKKMGYVADILNDVKIENDEVDECEYELLSAKLIQLGCKHKN